MMEIQRTAAKTELKILL